MPNETSISKKKLLLNIVKEHPAWGIDRYSFEFRKQGISFSRYSIWRSLRRFNLNRRYNRLIYIETLNNCNQPVTERSLNVLKRNFSKIQHGLWPGHIVALDTFYVGNLKGVGRIYQVTGIDLCSRYGWAKVYNAKDQIATTSFVENTLLPKFFHNGVELETILTDNGSEFTGNKFQGMLRDYEIKHSRIPKGKPIMNGYCERFQRTIHEEFYLPAFRRRFFKDISELNETLNQYLVYYNFERAHFGLHKTGAIPIDVFKSKYQFLRQRFQKLLT